MNNLEIKFVKAKRGTDLYNLLISPDGFMSYGVFIPKNVLEGSEEYNLHKILYKKLREEYGEYNFIVYIERNNKIEELRIISHEIGCFLEWLSNECKLENIPLDEIVNDPKKYNIKDVKGLSEIIWEIVKCQI